MGAVVTLNTSDYHTVDAVVTGDSHRSQHAPTVHFGLGRLDRVESLTVEWMDGIRFTLPDPQPNRYHLIPPADGG